MDMEYGQIGGPDNTEYRDFEQALTVVATVISRRPGLAIVDAGYKAFATDRPFTPVAVDLPGAVYSWAGDEHGRLDLTNVDRDIRVGDRLEFVPPHCDPTVNLYNQIHALRGNGVEAVWPVAAEEEPIDQSWSGESDARSRPWTPSRFATARFETTILALPVWRRSSRKAPASTFCASSKGRAVSSRSGSGTTSWRRRAHAAFRQTTRFWRRSAKRLEQ